MSTQPNSEHCRDERRRDLIRKHTDSSGQPDRNGIDYIEVGDDQRTLTVFFLGHAPDITLRNVRIDGGRRVTVRPVELRLCRTEDPDLDDCLTVIVDRPGDFSTYTLRLVAALPDHPSDEPLWGFDPRYAQIAFSFKVNCPSDLDCAAEPPCPVEPQAAPEINYLAKDYASFRQLILDRLALIMPEWRETHVPDIGIALVELLAYTGDYLSYYQDAVATEAYLNTARRRISVRRHARLVDYQLHEGCNARAWVAIETDVDDTLTSSDLYFTTGLSQEIAVDSPTIADDDVTRVSAAAYEVFEPLAAPATIRLRAAHSLIRFYSWGDAACCLPRGATSATLLDAWVVQPPKDDQSSQYSARQYPAPSDQSPEPKPDPQPEPGPAAPGERQRQLELAVGDVLIFEEVISPTTGLAADADPTRRYAVRLTSVERAVDTLTDTPVVEIAWSSADALPFALCVSAVGGADCRLIEAVSVARGNVLLVDHGRRTAEELLGPEQSATSAGCCGEGKPRPPQIRRASYDPALDQTPLTWAAPFPAPAAMAQRQAEILSAVIERIRTQVRRLWRRAERGEALDDAALGWLRATFGAQALLDSRLVRKQSAAARPITSLSSADQAAALRWLIAREEALLQRTFRRISGLLARAQSGYVLDSATVDEIAQLVGAQLAADLQPGAALYGPASAALIQNPREAAPQLTVHGRDPETQAPIAWQPRSDLFASAGTDRHVAVEIDNEQRAHLRFGDDTLGAAPPPGLPLQAIYRVGAGAAGNVGAESITQIVFRGGRIPIGVRRVRNPLPAQGGVEPELIGEAKLFAPSAFRRELVRAVVADDYARLAERVPGVQRAAATLRWTGSWTDVHVAIDPYAERADDPLLLDAVRILLARYQRIGHEVTVAWARSVPIHLAIDVCVRDGYARGQVKAALLDALGNRLLPHGRRGFFHPDNLTFGTSIALSRLVAAVQAAPGVETLRVTKLERLFEGPNDELATGLLPLRADEIARLDNDPNQPEHGMLALTLRGGR